MNLYNNLGRTVIKDLGDLTSQTTGQVPSKVPDQGSAKSFVDHLRDGVDEVNKMQNSADVKGVELATGKSQDLHEAMLAMAQAELSFNFMVQVRNKALDAYNQIMNMPV